MNATKFLKDLDGQEMSVEGFAARLSTLVRAEDVEAVAAALTSKGHIRVADGVVFVGACKRASENPVTNHELLPSEKIKFGISRYKNHCTLARGGKRSLKNHPKIATIQRVFGGEVLHVEYDHTETQSFQRFTESDTTYLNWLLHDGPYPEVTA